MDNSEKMATNGTKDEGKQNKNTIQYVLNTTICKQIKETSHEPSYKQHRIYAEIVTRTSQHGTQNIKTHNKTTQKR